MSENPNYSSLPYAGEDKNQIIVAEQGAYPLISMGGKTAQCYYRL